MVKCSKKEYCERQKANPFECSESEGCKLIYGWGDANDDAKSWDEFSKSGTLTSKQDKLFSGEWGRCVLNEDKNLPNTLFNGGFGYGKVCVPDVMTDFVIMLVYPPAYVFLYQKKRGFPNITMIITSFILTSCFYFPGLIHAMYLKQTGQSACGGLFTGEKSNKNVMSGVGGVGTVVEGTGEGVGSVGEEAGAAAGGAVAAPFT